MKYNAGNPNSKGIDPTLTRKRGTLSHPGSIIIGLIAIAFTAYIFGYLPQADTLFNSLVQAINGQRDTAITIYQLAPPVGIGIVLLILAIYIWNRLNDARKSMSKRSLVSGRPTVTEAQFAAIASRHSITSKVAHHTYKQLHHDYGHKMQIFLNDDLRSDLHWNDTHVLDVMGNLARRADRRKNLKASPDAIRTVLDLLLYVESCPQHSLTASTIRRRQGGEPSGVRKAFSTITRMVKPLHKRSGIVRAAQTPPPPSSPPRPPVP